MGIVEFDRPGLLERAQLMAGLVAHRGPDDDGAWSGPGVAFAFRRLAVIDVSSDAAQPMADESGRYRIVFNGEIYNYLELRAELETLGRRFRTGSDTEVLLASYLQWGTDCVRRFNGMWAFAIWDAGARHLFCSRDRFGIKPFYYRFDGRRFVFASELKAFRAGGERLRANLTAVRDYLEDGHLDHTDGTFFAGIQQLPPAHSLLLRPQGLTIRRYWCLEQGDPPGDPVEAVRDLFVDAVRLHLRSDVAVGTCLSGGIDSSAIAVVVAQLLRLDAEAAVAAGSRQRTVTAYFDEAGTDERPFARAVVAAIDAEPHWVTFTAGDVTAALPSIVTTQDEPFGSPSIVAQWYVMRAAREAGITVMLDGQGGDETFAGYHSAFGPFFADLLARGRPRELTTQMRAYSSLHSVSSGVTAQLLLRALVPHALRRDIRSRLTRSGISPAGRVVHRDLRALPPTPPFDEYVHRDRLRRTLHRQIEGWGLRELLRYEDRNSMAHGIEARVPFLDHRLVELAFSLGRRDRLDRGVTKTVVRQALADLLPPAVRDRRDKVGFGTPERSWLAGDVGNLAEEAFSSRELAERGFVEPGGARALLTDHRSGRTDASRTLWRVLSLELWAREFLDQSAPAPAASHVARARSVAAPGNV